jgi:hypothetical protein
MPLASGFEISLIALITAPACAPTVRTCRCEGELRGESILATAAVVDCVRYCLGEEVA